MHKLAKRLQTTHNDLHLAFFNLVKYFGNHFISTHKGVPPSFRLPSIPFFKSYFNQITVDELLGCFQSVAITDSAAITYLTYSSCTKASIFVRETPQRGIAV